jgi:hypothetical protein
MFQRFPKHQPDLDAFSLQWTYGYINPTLVQQPRQVHLIARCRAASRHVPRGFPRQDFLLFNPPKHGKSTHF